MESCEKQYNSKMRRKYKKHATPDPIKCTRYFLGCDWMAILENRVVSMFEERQPEINKEK